MHRPALFGVFLSAAVLVSFALPRISVAAPAAAPTPVPVHRPDFSSMNFMLGTWRCHSTLRGKNRPDTSTTTMTLDGAYMVTHDVAPPFDKYRTQAVRTDSYMTYNPRTHLWVTISVDNFAGYGAVTSPGWRGNTMTSTLVASQDGSSGSDTLTKVSDTQTRDVATNKTKDGHVTHTTTMCNKS